MVETYNAAMLGIDCLDQKKGYLMYPYRSYKWYMAEYHNCVEISLVNGFIMFQQANPDYKDTPAHWHEQVVDGLLGGWEKTTKCPAWSWKARGQALPWEVCKQEVSS